MAKCVICKEDIKKEANGWEGGCNADPIAEGRCCKVCDDTIVIPTRINMYFAQQSKKEDKKGEVK